MKKLNSLLFLFLALSAFHAKAQEGFVAPVDEELYYKRSNYKINERYSGGSYLIYNCKNDYYTCVDEYSNGLCLDQRKMAKEKNQNYYPCAPLKKFPTKKECLLENYTAVEMMALKRFCYPQN